MAGERARDCFVAPRNTLNNSARSLFCVRHGNCDDMTMRQTDLGLNLTTKRAPKREFLDKMNRAVPSVELEALISPFAREGRSCISSAHRDARNRQNECPVITGT